MEVAVIAIAVQGSHLRGFSIIVIVGGSSGSLLGSGSQLH